MTTPSTTEHERAYYDLQQRVWQRFARAYDAVVRPLRPLRRRIAALVQPRAGLRVLDVATGTGEQALVLAQAGADVVGVDLSPAMIDVARSKGALPNLRFDVADAVSLPYPDGSFDATTISFALHEMPPSVRARVVREIARVTRPGGTVVVVDYGLPRSALGRAVVPPVVALWERDEYRAFVQSNLVELLESAGISVTRDLPALSGVARTLVGVRAVGYA